MSRMGRSVFLGIAIGVGMASLSWLSLTDPELANFPAFACAGALGGLINGLIGARIERDRLIRMMIFGALSYAPTALAMILIFGELGFFALVYAPLFAPFLCAGVLMLEIVSRDELPMPIQRLMA